RAGLKQDIEPAERSRQTNPARGCHTHENTGGGDRSLPASADCRSTVSESSLRSLPALQPEEKWRSRKSGQLSGGLPGGSRRREPAAQGGGDHPHPLEGKGWQGEGWEEEVES